MTQKSIVQATEIKKLLFKEGQIQPSGELYDSKRGNPNSFPTARKEPRQGTWQHTEGYRWSKEDKICHHCRTLENWRVRPARKVQYSSRSSSQNSCGHFLCMTFVQAPWNNWRPLSASTSEDGSGCHQVCQMQDCTAHAFKFSHWGVHGWEGQTADDGWDIQRSIRPDDGSQA